MAKVVMLTGDAYNYRLYRVDDALACPEAASPVSDVIVCRSVIYFWGTYD